MPGDETRSRTEPSGGSAAGAGRRVLALAAVVATLVVLAIGGVVNARQASLSVPTWPTSYGSWTIVDRWTGNAVLEHSHRLAAVAAAVVLAAFLVVEWRRSGRRGAVAATGALFVTQVALGGAVVLLHAPPWLAAVHVLVAVGVGVGVLLLAAGAWELADRAPALALPPRAAPGPRLARWVAGALVLQVVLGALSRHPGTQPAFIAAFLAHLLNAMLLLALLPPLVRQSWRRGPGVDRRAGLALLSFFVVQLGVAAALFVVAPEPLREEWPPPAGFAALHVAHLLLATVLLALAVLLAARAARATRPAVVTASRTSGAVPGGSPAAAKGVPAARHPERRSTRPRVPLGVRLDGLAREAADAARGWLRRPAAGLLATTTLAIGMAAVASVLALADVLFVTPLAGIAEPGRLVVVKLEQGPASVPNFQDLAARSRSLESLAVLVDQPVSLGSGEAGERIGAVLVDAAYFPTLRVPFARGRAWGVEEAARGAAVAVIGHDLWRRRFGGAEDVVGRQLVVQGEPFTVVGVAPPGFVGTFRGFRYDLWIPLSTAPRVAPHIDPGDRELDRAETVARLRPGVAEAAAAAELQAVAARLAAEHPATQGEMRARLAPLTGLDEELRAPALVVVAVLLGLALLVLALTVANVAGVLLARLLARRGELAMRAALGASTGALARLLIWEALLLALGAAALGALGAAGAGRLLLRAVASLPLPIALDLAPQGRVLALLALLALAVSVLLVAPALSMLLRPGLLAAVRAESGGAAGRGRGRSALVVLQVAAATCLLLAAGLSLRALRNAATAEDGRLAAVHAAPFLDLHALRLGPSEGAALRRRLLAAAVAEPGVAAAALADRPPIPGGGTVELFPAEAPREPGREGLRARQAFVTEDYLATLGLPLLQGRGIRAGGAEGREAVVDAELARRLWGARPALGRELRVGEDTLVVVGVSETLPGPAGEARPTLYRSFWAAAPSRFALLVRGDGPAGEGLRRGCATALRTVAPAMVPVQLQPLAELRAVALLPQRLAAGAGGLLGGVGLLVAAAGLYALLSLLIAQASRELAVRAALGASPGALLAGVAGRAALLAGLGFAAGTALLLAVAAPLSRALGAGLDPGIVVGAALVVLLAAIAAAGPPAWRASRVDPARTLRGA